MKTRGAMGLFIACALALLFMAPAVRADDLNQATRLTFNKAIRIPNGVVLQPGTYWFTVGNDVTDQNVVRVTDANGSPITTLLVASADRLTPKDHTTLKLAEGAPNRPYTLVEWYYPGRLIGHEFLYSPQRENQISEEKQITVQAMPAFNGRQIASAQVE